MKQKQLEHFLAIHQSGSIASAARHLDMAQPALSLSLSKLEHELKTQLFVRGSKGVTLTESGTIFYDCASLVIRELTRAKQDIEELEGKPRGTIVLAMNQATANVLALPLMRKIEALYPEIDLDLRTGLSYEVTEMLRNHAADVAIIYEDGLETSDIDKELLIRESLFHIEQKTTDTAKQHNSEIPFVQVAKEEVVTPGGKESLAFILQEAEKQTGIHLKKRRPFGQLMTGLRFVCDGQCKMVLPSSAFFHLEEQHKLTAKKITEPEIYRNVYIATPQRRATPIRVLKLIELIKECSQEVHQKHQWRGVID